MTLGRPGDLLADRYRLDRFVSGAGSVERWRAFDERLARPVTARLEPTATDTEDPDGKELPAAAQATLTSIAQLNHPGVAAVYDVGTADGLRNGATVGYAISEWTEGRTLGQIMATGPQPWPRTAHWGQQISGALAALHAIGIGHGALSPQSVAIHDDRQVKILDVGLEPEAGNEADPSDATDETAAGDVETTEAAVGALAASRTAAEPTVRLNGTQDSDAARGSAIADAGDVEATEAGAGAGAEPTVRLNGTRGSDVAVAKGDTAGLPADAPDDIYALGFLLWEATVGTAPEYVIPDASAEASADEAGATRVQPVAKPADEAATAAGAATSTEPGSTKPTVAGIDQRPLLETGAPAEFAALLAQMLSGDPASRPTAAEAERRFEPFARVERVGDAPPAIAAAAAAAAVAAGARTQVLGPPVAGAAIGAAGAEAARAERDRRRGTMLGLVLLVAAALAGLGLLLANLSSHHSSPTVVDTVIPSSSPGMVTLPNGSLSPAPTLTPAKGGQPAGHASSVPASTAPTSQQSASPSASPPSSPSSAASPSASATASSGTNNGGGGAPSSSAGPASPSSTPVASNGPQLSSATTQRSSGGTQLSSTATQPGSSGSGGSAGSG